MKADKIIKNAKIFTSNKAAYIGIGGAQRLGELQDLREASHNG